MLTLSPPRRLNFTNVEKKSSHSKNQWCGVSVILANRDLLKTSRKHRTTFVSLSLSVA